MSNLSTSAVTSAGVDTPSTVRGTLGRSSRARAPVATLGAAAGLAVLATAFAIRRHGPTRR